MDQSILLDETGRMLAVAGLICVVLLVPMISVTAVTVLTYGQTRFRATAEPSIVVLASLAVVWAVDAVRRRRVNASN